ncbi:MAG: MFS transporter [Hyphomicrobiales bacterium]
MTAIAMDDTRVRRNVLILAIGQGLYSSTTVILIATAGLVGVMLAPSKSWATLPVSTFVIGTMLSTIPASHLMQRLGRRPGFLIGAVFGLLGALLAIYAIYVGSFALFCLAAAFQGTFQASSGFMRFAAADISSPAFRPKAISWVLTGGVVAAIFGTLIVIRTTDLLAPFTFAGCYAASAVLSIATMFALLRLDIPKPRDDEDLATTRPLSEILRQPRTLVAIACATLSYGMMNLVMTATPIAMVDCGFVSTDASWVIQWHVLGMFVPSFFTGHLIARFGVEKICLLGMTLLVGSAIVAMLGIDFANFAIALILLGLGWNFGFIGGTTLLTGSYAPSERAKVQGFNDFAISVTMAIASLASGKLLSGLGWNAVNLAVFPMAAIAIALILWLARQPRTRPA